jgi:ribosomal-protein-alanine N-acetyltransferase
VNQAKLAPPEPPLGDGCVSLRPLDEEDVAAIELALADAEICRWFNNRTVSAGDVLERATAGWRDADAANFAIVDRDRCVGSIWLNIGSGGRASVGYWLLPDARGKGLVTRSIALVARWAFGELGMQRISLLADPRNEASVRVAERAGFKREGVLRSWTDVNGERVDHVSYSLIPADLDG